MLYFTPDRADTRWRQPFIYALASFFNVTQIHYRLKNTERMARSITESGEKIDAILLDTNTTNHHDDLLRALKVQHRAPLVQYWVDIREAFQTELGRRGEIIDCLAWSNDDPGLRAAALASGVRAVRYLPAPSDPGIYFHDPSAEKRWSACFIGNRSSDRDLAVHGADRDMAVVALAGAVPQTKIVGNGWANIGINAERLDFFESADVVRASRIALSISHYHHYSGYASNRLLHMIFSGTPTIYRRFEGSEKLIRDRWATEYDGTTSDLLRKVDMILANTERYNDMAATAAREASAAYSRHRWAARMAHYVSETIKCHNAR